MKSYKSILAGVDLSADSRSALREAVKLASQHQARLAVYQVIPGDIIEDFQAMEDQSCDEILESARKALAAAVAEDTLGYESVTPKVEVVVGTPYAGLMSAIREEEADLLVLGSRGNSKKVGKVGVIAAKCTRQSPISVLLAMGDRTKPFEQVIACVDFSDTTGEVLASAARMAVGDQARMDVVHVNIPPWLSPLNVFHEFKGDQNEDYRRQYKEILQGKLDSETREAAEFYPIEVRTTLLFHAEPSHALIDHVIDSGADLAVLGSHGRSGMHDFLLGTTVERIMHLCNCSLLVVKAERNS